MKRTIGILSGKGGVGKTSISVLVAKILSENARVILLDFDICGPSILRALNINEPLIKSKVGFYPIRVSDTLEVLSFGSMLKPTDAVIWRGAKKLMFLSMFYSSISDQQFVVIDTPPGISEEHEFLVDKPIDIIIVTSPQNISLSDAKRCIEFCKVKNINIVGLIENMSGILCENCMEVHYPFGANGGKQLAEDYGILFLGSLPLDNKLGKYIDEGLVDEEYKDTKPFFLLKAIIKSLYG